MGALYGLGVPVSLLWAMIHDEEHGGDPARYFARRRNLFGARALGLDVRHGTRLALCGVERDELNTARQVARLRELHPGAQIPLHREPMAALRGRIVAVARVETCVHRSPVIADGGPPSTWCDGDHARLWGVSDPAPWWVVLRDVIALPLAVEASSAPGLWGLPEHTSVAVMAQVHRIERDGRAA